MILDFFDREGEASQKFENYEGFGGRWFRVDNAVRFICDYIKYILWLYIGLLIVELEVLRKEGGYNNVCKNMGVSADGFGWIMLLGLSVTMSNIYCCCIWIADSWNGNVTKRGGEIAEGGITGIKGSRKIILRLQYNCTNDSEIEI